MTLREFRESIDNQIQLWDASEEEWGGCGCGV